MKRWLRWGAGLVVGFAIYHGVDLGGPNGGPATTPVPPTARSADSASETTRAPAAQRVAINEAHIFEGEINRRGKPVGFHARPGGRDPAGARVERIRTGPNRLGVYVATVAIRDHASHQWLEKRSTFFPDDMSRSEVLAAIQHAYANREAGVREPWRGPSGRGFTIQGYVNRGRINTAYPIFR